MITLPDSLFTEITEGHGQVPKVQSSINGRALLPLKDPCTRLLLCFQLGPQAASDPRKNNVPRTEKQDHEGERTISAFKQYS